MNNWYSKITNLKKDVQEKTTYSFFLCTRFFFSFFSSFSFPFPTIFSVFFPFFKTLPFTPFFKSSHLSRSAIVYLSLSSPHNSSSPIQSGSCESQAHISSYCLAAGIQKTSSSQEENRNWKLDNEIRCQIN